MDKVKEIVIKTIEDPTCVTPNADGFLTVSGSLVVNLAVEVQVNYLKLGFSGESRCDRSVWRGQTRTTKSPWDSLFKEEQALISNGATPTTLTSGSHVYPFIFQIRIDRHIPSSWRSPYGYIGYHLYAKMNRAGVVSDDKSSKSITVYNPLMLNMSQYLTPVSFDKEHTDCCLRCISGPAIVEATINRTALTLLSSDKIDVTLTIDNLMSKSLIPRVSLEEVGKLHAIGNTKYCITRLCEAEGQVLRPNTRNNLVQVQLGPVIADVVGTVKPFNNISVEYRVLVKLKGSKFLMEYPIMMGLDSAAAHSVT